jgi:uncharacterized membrane protein
MVEAPIITSIVLVHKQDLKHVSLLCNVFCLFNWNATWIRIVFMSGMNKLTPKHLASFGGQLTIELVNYCNDFLNVLAYTSKRNIN